MFDQAVSLLVVATMTLAAFGVGRPMLRGLGVGCEDSLSTAVWSLAAGWIIAGLAITALGLLHLLYVSVIGTLTLLAAFWGLGELCFVGAAEPDDAGLGDAETDDDSTSDPPATALAPPRWVSKGIGVLAGLACLGSLVGALAPPTAGDALCYHLELPKVFLAGHAIRDLPFHDNATYPLLTEMWYLWGLALDGPVAAQLVHWVMGILLALGAVLLATPIVGRPWAWVVGSAVLLVPGVNNQMTAPLCDVALAAMVTLAVTAWWRAAIEDQSPRWFLLAGLAGGAALGVKYTALLAVGAMLPVWAWTVWRQPERRAILLQGAAVAAIVAASVAGVWYMRAAWYWGNPVYPYFVEYLGPAPTPGDPMPDNTLPDRKSRLGRSPLALAVSPLAVTLYPERFGGRAQQLGVLGLATLPGLFWVRRLRGLGTLLAIAGSYWLLWFLMRQNVRFLLPVVPLLVTAGMWVWAEMHRLPRPARLAACVLLAAAAAATALIPLARVRDRVAVAIGWEGRTDYLRRCEPTYQAAEVIAQGGSRQFHILSQDHRTFWFDCSITRENVYRRAARYDRNLADGGQLSRYLREQGFSHLLLAETTDGSGPPSDPTLSRLAEEQLKATPQSLVTLADYRFRDVEGAERRYRLVMLR